MTYGGNTKPEDLQEDGKLLGNTETSAGAEAAREEEEITGISRMFLPDFRRVDRLLMLRLAHLIQVKEVHSQRRFHKHGEKFIETDGGLHVEHDSIEPDDNFRLRE